MRRLVNAAAQCRGEWQAALCASDVGGVLRGVRACLEHLQSETKYFSDEATGYVRSFLTRKIVIARAMTTNGPPLEVDWAAMPRDQLAQMCADENGYLNEFPAYMPAADVSDLVFERPDLGVFVSMWGCLWKDPIVPRPPQPRRRPQERLERIMQFIASGAYEREASAARFRTGLWPCPALVVQACERAA
jgi:hypothetical protein